jgi:hypothetical protein
MGSILKTYGGRLMRLKLVAHRTIVPNGTWFIYVQNFTGSEIQYTLSVTPLFRGGKP